MNIEEFYDKLSKIRPLVSKCIVFHRTDILRDFSTDSTVYLYIRAVNKTIKYKI